MRNMVTFPARETCTPANRHACSRVPGPGCLRAQASWHRREAPAAAWRRRARASTIGMQGKAKTDSASALTLTDQRPYRLRATHHTLRFPRTHPAPAHALHAARTRPLTQLPAAPGVATGASAVGPHRG